MGWALLSVVATSALFFLMRGATESLDSRYVVLLRFAGTFAIAAPLFVALPPARRTLRLSRPRLHLMRGLLFFVSAHLGIYAIAHLELVTATILMFTAPLFATLLGATLLGQPVGARRIAALATGFVGVVIVLRPTGAPTGDPTVWAMAAALGSAVLFAGALIMSRSVSAADGPLSTLLTSSGLTALASIPLAAPVILWPLPGTTLLLLLAMILTGMVRMFADIRAYSAGDAAVIAPIVYLRLVFVAIGGYLIWGEIPKGNDLIGAAVIICAALYIAQREARLRKSG